MIQTLLLLFACPAVSLAVEPRPAVALTKPPVICPQDEEEKPDKRELIKEMVDTFGSHIKKRGAEDREALGVVDKMLGEWGNCGPKDRKSIVRILSRALNENRRADKDGQPNNMLFVAVAVAFGRMAPESAPELMKWIGHKKHKKDLKLQRYLILSLGKAKDKKGLKVLIGLLRHKDSPVQAATAEALAHYRKKDQRIRKDVFEEVLKVLNEAFNAKEGSTSNREAAERYDVIAAPMISTLQALSGATVRTSNKWRVWWNDNKRRKWDDV